MRQLIESNLPLSPAWLAGGIYDYRQGPLTDEEQETERRRDEYEARLDCTVADDEGEDGR